MKKSIFASLAVLTLAMLACSLGSGGGNKTITPDELQAAFDQLPAGDATRGEQIFLSQPCHTCHLHLPAKPTGVDQSQLAPHYNNSGISSVRPTFS